MRHGRNPDFDDQDIFGLWMSSEKSLMSQSEVADRALGLAQTRARQSEEILAVYDSALVEAARSAMNRLERARNATAAAASVLESLTSSTATTTSSVCLRSY